MAEFNDIEQKDIINEEESEIRTFSPIYSYSDKINRLIAEGKIVKPKYRTLSQEQYATYIKAQDLPEYERLKKKTDINVSNDLFENMANQGVIEAADMLSFDNTRLAIGNMLITGDFTPLMPLATGFSTAVSSIAGALIPTPTASESEERKILEQYMTPEQISEQEKQAKESIESAYTPEQLKQMEEAAEDTKVQALGRVITQGALDEIQYKASVAPYVDEKSIGAGLVGGATSFGELFAIGAGIKILGGQVAKAIATPAAVEKGISEAALTRYAGAVGGKAGTIASLGEMSSEIMGQGALQSIRKYIEETGDTKLEFYDGDAKNLALDALNTTLQNVIEYKWGVGRFFKNPRIVSKYGEWLNGFVQEFTQGGVNDIFEYIKGDQEAKAIIENLPQNILEGLIGAVLQGGTGTAVYHFYHTNAVNDLTSVIMGQSTAENPISEKDARAFAEKKIVELEEGIVNDMTHEIIDFAGASKYEGQIYNVVRDNVEKAINYQRERMKDTIDGSKYDEMTEDELAQHIEGVAQDMTDRAVIDALDRKIPLSESPILKGETIDGTYYVEGSDYARQTRQNAEAQRQVIRDAVFGDEIQPTKEESVLEDSVEELRGATKDVKDEIQDIKEKLEERSRPYTTQEEEEIKTNLRKQSADKAAKVVSALKEMGIDAQPILTKGKQEIYKSEDSSAYFRIGDRLFRISYDTNASKRKHRSVDSSFYTDMDVAEIIRNIQVRLGEPVSTTELYKFGTPEVNPYADVLYKRRRPSTKEVHFQDRQRGKGGAYDARTRSVTLGAGANATTFPHELAHYWIDKNFKWARSGKASAAWLAQWRAVEKWLGIDPEDKYLSKAASEKFARAYERFFGEEELPLVLKKAMADFRDFVLDHYDYDLDEARGLQDSLGRPLQLNDDMRAWFRKSIYDSYMSPAETEVVNARLEKDEQEAKIVRLAIEESQKLENAAQNSQEIAQVAPTGTEIQTNANISNNVVLGKTKQSQGVIGKALGKTYESTTWDEQEELVNAYLDSVSLEDALDALENGSYPDRIDANFLRQGVVEKLLDAGRDMEAAALIEETSEDFTQAAQTLQAARRINTPFANAIHMLTMGNAERLAVARYGKKPGAMEKLDAAINALITKYEQDFMNAKTDEERELVFAAMQDEAVRTIGTLNKDSSNGLDFQEVEDKEERKQAKEIRRRQFRRASINAYRSRAKRALKQALGVEPNREQVKQSKKLSVDVAKQIRNYRKAVKENKESAIDPTSILEAQNKLNEYMNEQLPPRVISNIADMTNSYMMANMLWNPATNVFNLESTWVQMIPHMMATYINYGKGTIPWGQKIALIKQALALQAKTGYNIFSLQDFFDKKTIWAEKFYEPTSKTGKFIRFPLTMLGLADTMNKGVVFLQHADSMATKQAREEGKKNGWNATQIEQRAKELFYQALNTDPRTITIDGLKIRKSAVLEGEEATFTQSTETAKFVNQARKMLNFGAKTGLGNVIMPFTTTVANIAEDTVLNYGLGSVRGAVYAPRAILTQFDKAATAEIKKEAWNKVKPETKNVIKNIIGLSMLLAIALSNTDDDECVLGYDRQTDVDKDIRQNRNAPSGYAIRIGNRWIDLDLFGIGSPWAKMNLIARRHGFTTDGWIKGVASLIDLVPGVEEIQDIYDTFSQTSQYKGEKEAISEFAEGKLEDIAQRLIPMQALLNELGNIQDPVKRVGWGSLRESVYSKIPFLRTRLETRTSRQTGQPLPQKDTWWNLVTGQRIKEYVEPTVSDKARYEFAQDGKALAYRESNSKLKELGKDTPEFNEAVAKVRRLFTEKLEKEAQTKAYKEASIEEKRKIANKLHTQALDEIKREYGLSKPLKEKKVRASIKNEKE